MKEKIKEILAYYDLNQKEFAQRINVSAQTISDILNDKKKAGDKITTGVLDSFPEINPLWLIRNIGDMFLDEKIINELNKTEKRDLSFKSMAELALFCVNNENELMTHKVFSNMVERNAAYKVVELVSKIKNIDS